MVLSAAELAALESGLVRIGVFFRMTLSPPLRLWLGVGSIEPGVNAFDTTGATYLGLGELRNVPEFSQLINGAAERVEFTMSGVSGELLERISGSANDVKGCEVALGYGLFDQAWQLISSAGVSVRWARVFYADFLAFNQAASDTDLIRTITLSCGSLMTGRRRPGLSYYSDTDQQARFPGDRFCERVPKYAVDVTKPWPRF